MKSCDELPLTGILRARGGSSIKVIVPVICDEYSPRTRR